MSVAAVPDRYPVITPYICVKGGAKAIDFYTKAFGATERMRMEAPGGVIGHAELEIAGGLIMLADEHPDMGFRSPCSLGGSPVTIHVYVEDVDSFVERAIASGASIVSAITDQFYGDRSAQLRDPFGHVWSIATHKEDVSPEEMKKRAKALFG